MGKMQIKDENIRETLRFWAKATGYDIVECRTSTDHWGECKRVEFIAGGYAPETVRISFVNDKLYRQMNKFNEKFVSIAELISDTK